MKKLLIATVVAVIMSSSGQTGQHSYSQELAKRKIAESARQNSERQQNADESIKSFEIDTAALNDQIRLNKECILREFDKKDEATEKKKSTTQALMQNESILQDTRNLINESIKLLSEDTSSIVPTENYYPNAWDEEIQSGSYIAPLDTIIKAKRKRTLLDKILFRFRNEN